MFTETKRLCFTIIYLRISEDDSNTRVHAASNYRANSGSMKTGAVVGEVCTLAGQQSGKIVDSPIKGGNDMVNLAFNSNTLTPEITEVNAIEKKPTDEGKSMLASRVAIKDRLLLKIYTGCWGSKCHKREATGLLSGERKDGQAFQDGSKHNSFNIDKHIVCVRLGGNVLRRNIETEHPHLSSIIRSGHVVKRKDLH